MEETSWTSKEETVQEMKQNSLILETHQLFVVFAGKVDTTGGHVQKQIWKQKQNSHEAVLVKNKILDQWVIWYYKILYYSMVRNE